MPYTYEYPRPMVTVDAVLFRRHDVLLIRRGREPFAGSWALPGGFVEMDETLDAAAARELEEETGLTGMALEQFHAFGDPGRDPRGRSIAVAYWGVAGDDAHPQGGDDAVEAAWFPVTALPPLAFDHGKIIRLALTKYTPSQP